MKKVSPSGGTFFIVGDRESNGPKTVIPEIGAANYPESMYPVFL